MQIGNFTPEAIQWTHVGISGWIHPGEIKEFDERRGNFIMSSVGKRGLVRLEWYDPDKDPEYMERKKVESRKQYEKFWNYQVENFNQHNETLKNEGKPYVRPSQQIRDKAKELNLPIVGPWQLQNAGANPEVRSLQSENAQLKEQMGEMQKMMQEMQKMMKQMNQPANQPAAETDPPADQPDWEAEKRRFKGLTNKTLVPFITKHKDEINTWPEFMIDALMERYETVMEEPFDVALLS